MKVSFPYMGPVIAYKKLLENLGHEVIMPHRPTQKTFDTGVLYSPEFICYPFKVMMGTYFDVCQRGAEVIISSGGSGPCRAGMYCEVHEKILKDQGYDVPIIVFDSIFKNPKKFFSQLKMVTGKTPLFKIVKWLIIVSKMVNQLDFLQSETNKLRAYEVNKGDFEHCTNEIEKLYDKVSDLKSLKETFKKAKELLYGVKTDKSRPRIRIGVVGEIYVAMESATNMNVEKRLNALGAEVYNIQNISGWIKHNIIPKRFNHSESWKAWNKALKYKTCACGGHDMENTGYIMEFAEMGFDGVVHLMPFGCLPELITRSILPQLSEEYDIPVLTMSIDEQNGEANTQTRLEAFVDLCKNRKAKKLSPSGKAKNSYESNLSNKKQPVCAAK